MPALEVTSKVRDQFIYVTTLLGMFDSVRNEAILHSLDKDLTKVELAREKFLKRKFLDSFALICTVREGRDSVSAVCIEEG